MNDYYAIVVSQFNSEITSLLLSGALRRLEEAGVSKENITVIHVPGAVEIPLIAKRLAKQKKYAAIIALGCVIRGDTSHYDYVCSQVSEGCQRVMLDEEVPVIFGVLTTEDERQAHERVGGVHGHKGVDAAEAAMEMAALMRKI